MIIVNYINEVRVLYMIIHFKMADSVHYNILIVIIYFEFKLN